MDNEDTTTVAEPGTEIGTEIQGGPQYPEPEASVRPGDQPAPEPEEKSEPEPEKGKQEKGKQKGDPIKRLSFENRRIKDELRQEREARRRMESVVQALNPQNKGNGDANKEALFEEYTRDPIGFIERRTAEVQSTADRRMEAYEARSWLMSQPASKEDPEFSKNITDIMDRYPQIDQQLPPSLSARAYLGLYMMEMAEAFADAEGNEGGEGGGADTSVRPQPATNTQDRIRKTALSPKGGTGGSNRMPTEQEIANMPLEKWEQERKRFGL